MYISSETVLMILSCFSCIFLIMLIHHYADSPLKVAEMFDPRVAGSDLGIKAGTDAQKCLCHFDQL